MSDESEKIILCTMYVQNLRAFPFPFPFTFCLSLFHSCITENHKLDYLKVSTNSLLIILKIAESKINELVFDRAFLCHRTAEGKRIRVNKGEDESRL